MRYADDIDVGSGKAGMTPEAGSSPGRLLSATVYLRDISDFSGMNAVWEQWLADRKAAAPVRTTVEAALATDGLRIEVTVVAAEDDA